MEIITKTIVLCLISSVCVLLLKKTVPEMSFGVMLTAMLLLCVVGARMLAPIFSWLRETADLLGAAGVYAMPILKTSIIGIISSIGSALCKDAGQTAFASAVEITGVISAIYTALPIFELFVHTIGELL